jgi:GTP-binding protein EngB required for normal cell division
MTSLNFFFQRHTYILAYLGRAGFSEQIFFFTGFVQKNLLFLDMPEYGYVSGRKNSMNNLFQ